MRYEVRGSWHGRSHLRPLYKALNWQGRRGPILPRSGRMGLVPAMDLVVPEGAVVSDWLFCPKDNIP